MRRSRKVRFERCVMSVKKQPGYNPYAVCHASINHKNYMKQLDKGTTQEHKEHPEFSVKQARMIARDHLKENMRYYAK